MWALRDMEMYREAIPIYIFLSLKVMAHGQILCVDNNLPAEGHSVDWV